MSGKMAFALYKPHEGQEDALMAVVAKHLPALREFGLISARDGYLARAQDGTVIEIFEWLSAESPGLAHQHPGVAAIWEAIGQIADFPAMAELPEAGTRFPNFDLL